VYVLQSSVSSATAAERSFSALRILNIHQINSRLTNKLCSKLSSSEVRFYTEIGRFAFLAPLGDLRATYDDHLGFIGESVADFLLALIEIHSLGVTVEGL